MLALLAGPHGADRYTELVDPMWTSADRATVVRTQRTTPRSVTLWLQPNHGGSAAGSAATRGEGSTAFRAGQFVSVTVEIDGGRHTRCYSPANAEESP